MGHAAAIRCPHSGAGREAADRRERALLPGGLSRNCPIDGRAHRDCGDAAARGVVRSHHQCRAHAGPAAQRGGAFAGRRHEQFSVRLAAATEGGGARQPVYPVGTSGAATGSGRGSAFGSRCPAPLLQSSRFRSPLARTARRCVGRGVAAPIMAGDRCRSRSLATARGNGCRHRPCIRARSRAV